MSGLRVLQPGTFTTIQDLGRPGHRSLGIPPAGAFDRAAHAIANALVANPANSATLELTLVGGVFEALQPLALALAGAPLDARLEADSTPTRRLRVPSAFSLLPGQLLRIGGSPTGARAYLAVHGGWQTETSLGSRSCELPLSAGAVLPARSARIPSLWPRFQPEPESDPTTLQCLDGPDADILPPETWRDHQFTVLPLASRMGIRLDTPTHPAVPPPDPDRLSTPVAPGALQWTGSGWILLGAACGTMGGYPHAAHVIDADLDRLAQLRPGQSVSLRRVSPELASTLSRQARQALDAFLIRLQTHSAAQIQLAD